MDYRVTARSQSLSSSEPPPLERLTSDPVTQKTAQSTVTCLYQSHISGFWRNVTVLWSKNYLSHSLSISVDSTMEIDRDYTCKIDLKPWHFWAKKGYKTFEVDGHQLEAYWDLRSAKFCGSPEPTSNYYVALVSEEEVVLLLGDLNKKAYKRTNSRPAVVDGVMLYKKEHVFGKKSFSTRVKFDQRKREHEIVVESSTTGTKDPEMWISVDGIVLIHVNNLQWKFRGNQTVLVNKQPVQVLWDVFAWLFCSPGSNHGLFIFKPGGSSEVDSEEEESSRCEDESDCSEDSRYYSVRSYSKASKFSLFLYAWKLE